MRRWIPVGLAALLLLGYVSLRGLTSSKAGGAAVPHGGPAPEPAAQGTELSGATAPAPGRESVPSVRELSLHVLRVGGAGQSSRGRVIWTTVTDRRQPLPELWSPGRGAVCAHEGAVRIPVDVRFPTWVRVTLDDEPAASRLLWIPPGPEAVVRRVAIDPSEVHAHLCAFAAQTGEPAQDTTLRFVWTALDSSRDGAGSTQTDGQGLAIVRMVSPARIQVGGGASAGARPDMDATRIAPSAHDFVVPVFVAEDDARLRLTIIPEAGLAGNERPGMVYAQDMETGQALPLGLVPDLQATIEARVPVAMLRLGVVPQGVWTLEPDALTVEPAGAEGGCGLVVTARRSRSGSRAWRRRTSRSPWRCARPTSLGAIGMTCGSSGRDSGIARARGCLACKPLPSSSCARQAAPTSAATIRPGPRNWRFS